MYCSDVSFSNNENIEMQEAWKKFSLHKNYELISMYKLEAKSKQRSLYDSSIKYKRS